MINFFSQLTNDIIYNVKHDLRNTDSLAKTSIGSLYRSLNVLGYTLNAKFTPYDSFTSHAKSLVHPFAHLTQLGMNIAHAAYDVCIFAIALLSFNGSGATQALGSLCDLTIASSLEIINIACSIITLTTRTLASICNQGYNASKDNQNKNDEIHLTVFNFV